MRRLFLMLVFLPGAAFAQMNGGLPVNPSAGLLPTGDASNTTITVAGGTARVLAGALNDQINILNILPQISGATDYTSTLNVLMGGAATIYLPNTGTPYQISGSISPAAGATLVCQPGATISATTSATILTVNNPKVTVRDCTFTGGSGSLAVISSDHFSWQGGGSTGTGGIFFNTSNASYGLVENTRQVNNTGSVFNLQNSANNITIRHNEIQSSGGFGIWITLGANANDIEENWTDSNAIELVGITYSAFDNRVIGNRARGTGDNCFSVSGYSNIVVGNKAQGCAFTGIYVYGDKNTVTGNEAIDNGQAHNPAFKYYNASNSSLYVGIEINGNFGGTGSNNAVTGNYVDDDQATKTQAYAGEIGSGYANWVASTAYAASAYVNNAGIIYQNQGGAATSGTTAPTCTSGTCSDGTITWTYIVTSQALSREPVGNVYGPNALNRSSTATFLDATINHYNQIYLEYAYFQSSQNTTGDSVITGGLQKKAATWASGTTYPWGSTIYTGSGSNRYMCVVPGGGTSTVSPTNTSGTQAEGDGYSWRFIGSGYFNQIAANNSQGSVYNWPLSLLNLSSGSGSAQLAFGNNNPTGIVAAPQGSLYVRGDGVAGSTLYAKESGTGAAGWSAVTTNTLSATTGSLGGSALAAGACASGTVSVANATTGMAVVSAPVTFPGAGYHWEGYVSAAGTVTEEVCAIVAGTPTASTYNVRVLQ